MKRAIISTGCALAGAVIFAAESPLQPKSKAEPEESLATVKRDFAAIKSAREAAGNLPLDLPRLTAPELQMEVRRPSATKAPVPEKKSANWLVDAVEGNKAGVRGEPGRVENEGSVRFTTEGGAEDALARAPRTKARRDDRKAGQTAEAAFNPFTSFMAGWLTPQDIALLRPTTGEPTASEAIARGERPREFSERPLSVAQPGKTSELFIGREIAPPTTTVPRLNPFLESIGSPAINPASKAGPPIANRAPPALAIALPPVESSPAKPKVPEFAKPSEDEKYFKQLKRF